MQSLMTTASGFFDSKKSATTNRTLRVKLVKKHLWIAVTIVDLLSRVCASPAHIMDSIDAEKFLGKWWVDSYSQAIYGDADRCAHVVLTKQAGESYQIQAEYISEEGELVTMSIDVKEDSQHPARFYLDMGDQTLMEIAIVGTDYANWAVVWAKSGSAASYNVITRAPNMEDKFHDPIQAVLDKANLKKVNFQRVSNEDCSKKDTI
ncbi:uncharacterized protein LOC111258552 isoform X1 [Varroa jacobsoni]|uniref:uncharacterized protein LOC111258552 isoform X1 n=1 Tax=Varroa jacobsoni TaxID=62625 RepID=UPI000BF57178|nr:uncharacterized protein LOC111258552 isoform X1 [Varroa jacobsoni]